MQNRQRKPIKLIPKGFVESVKPFAINFLKGVWWGMGPDPRKKPQNRRIGNRYG